MRRRTSSLLLLVVAGVLVNLPLVHATWTDLRIDRSGIDVTAEVVDTGIAGGQHLVTFRFPAPVESDEEWTADVDEATYDDAAASGEIGVRVVPDDPAAYRVHGQVGGSALLVITLVADALLLLAGLLLWRYGGRPQLRAIALGDVERCPPGSALDRVADEIYLVRGEVSAVEADRVVIDVGDRSVVVLLDGHRNPVGHQQAAQVRARLV